MTQKIFLITLLINIALGNTGVITGSVMDISTQQPLPGVNVIIEDTEMGAASDIEGNFTVRNVPIGFYHVRFSAIGYKPLVKLNIRVVSNRPAIINAELEQKAIELEEDAIWSELAASRDTKSAKLVSHEETWK